MWYKCIIPIYIGEVVIVIHITVSTLAYIYGDFIYLKILYYDKVS